MLVNIIKDCFWLSIRNVPNECFLLALINPLIAVIIMYFFDIKKIMHYTMLLLYVEYVLLLFGSFVVFRVAKTVSEYNLMPFWSYIAYQNGESELLAQNILNTLAFMPIGIFGGMAFHHSMTWLKLLVIGLTVSTSIEVFQFVFNRGFAEIDDIMHNTLGCLIGYGIVVMVDSIYLRCSALCKHN